MSTKPRKRKTAAELKRIRQRFNPFNNGSMAAEKAPDYAPRCQHWTSARIK